MENVLRTVSEQHRGSVGGKAFENTIWLKRDFSIVRKKRIPISFSNFNKAYSQPFLWIGVVQSVVLRGKFSEHTITFTRNRFLASL